MQNKVDKAVAILERLYPEEEVEIEMTALRNAIAAEDGEDSMRKKLHTLITSPELRPAVVAGVGISVNHYYRLFLSHS